MSKAVDEDAAHRFYQAAADDIRRGGLEKAGDALARAWRAAPNQPRSATGLLQCASRLAMSGSKPASTNPTEDRSRADGMISFVICSVTPSKLARLKLDISRTFSADAHEIVHIGDAKSLCEGNMRGLRQSRGELLVFCHDDIGIINDDFAARLRGQLAQFDLIGLAGTRKLEGPSWHWGGPLTAASRVAFPSQRGELKATLLGTDVRAMPDAQALDGVFVAGHRHVFEKVPYDADTFDGFHLYDIDQSYRAYLAGFSCAVALDLFIWHESGGSFNNEDWRRYAERFVLKFPIATPHGFPAPYRAGTLPMDARWIPDSFAWIDRWLAAVERSEGA